MLRWRTLEKEHVWWREESRVHFWYVNFEISIRNQRTGSRYETRIQGKVGTGDNWKVSAYRFYVKQ